MTHEEQILARFDEYFENASKAEIEADVKAISNLGLNGVTFEQYIDVLNKVTSFNLGDTGICDDIAYSGWFNALISPIEMNDSKLPTLVQAIALEYHSAKDFNSTAGEETYAMAA